MRNKIVCLLSLLVPVLLLSCATSVPVTVLRPAELNLNGAKTIAVLPVQISDTVDYNSTGNAFVDVVNALNYLFSDEDQNEVDSANHLTTELTKRLAESPYLKLIDSTVVEKALKKGDTAPVDVYLTGKITDFTYYTDSVDRKEKKNDKEFTVAYYKIRVNAKVMYEIVDAKTRQVIAYRTKDLSDESYENKDRRSLPTPFEIISDEIESLARQIMKEIQPYEETKYLSLLKDKTKNADMTVANELAKQGLVEQSEQKYYQVYESTGSFTAGYNAAKLLQAEGKLDEAKELMLKIMNNSYDKRSVAALRDIQYDIDQRTKLENQQAAQQNNSN